MNIYLVTLVCIAMFGCNNSIEASWAQSVKIRQHDSIDQAIGRPNSCPTPIGVKTTQRVFINEVDTIQACRIVATSGASIAVDTFRLTSSDYNQHFRVTLIRTSSGESLNYRLPCGAEVWQNVWTDIHWMNKDGFVRVMGEAQFKVGKTPLAVQVGDATIFCPPYGNVNIRRWRDDTLLTVTSLKGTMMFTTYFSSLSLEEGHDIVYNFNGQIVHGTSDSTEVAAWTEGSIDSENIGLRAVAAILGRWYNKEFVVQTKRKPPEKGLGWTFAANDLAESLRMLENVYRVRCVQQGKRITITDGE